MRERNFGQGPVLLAEMTPEQRRLKEQQQLELQEQQRRTLLAQVLLQLIEHSRSRCSLCSFYASFHPFPSPFSLPVFFFLHSSFTDVPMFDSCACMFFYA